MKKILTVTFAVLNIISSGQLQANSDSSQNQNTSAVAVPGGKSLHDHKDCGLTIKDEAANNHEDVSNKETGSAWIEYSTRSNGDVFFYDNTRIEKNDSQITVWVRVRYKTSVMAASSYQSHLKLDCTDNSEAILQDTFYTDKNWTKPAMATNTNAKPKKQIQKNSATEQLIGILCKDL